MNDNIATFGGITTLDLPPERVLFAALERGMQGVIVLGYDGQGAEYFASSYGDKREVVWLIERFKAMLLAEPQGEGGGT